MRPTVWQAAALLYLVLPLALFLLFFSSYVMASAGLCFVFWASWRFLRDGVRCSLSWPLVGALLLIACVFVASTGSLPPLMQTGDYTKHYGILNLLLEHHWPVVIDAGLGPEILRYPLGWYLVPAGMSKVLGPRTLDYTLAAWSALGLWIVFLLLAEALQTGSRSRWWSVLATIMFMFFSGLDQLGVALTGNRVAYADHFEWWSTFYQFSSFMTDLVWVPQHGIATWMAVALLLNVAHKSKVIAHFGLFFFAVLFWSPLCALGVVPLVLVAGRARAFRQFFSLSNCLSLVALAPPLLGYLTASMGRIPHAWIFRIPGWTVRNLVCFWLFEFGIFALLVWAIGTSRKAMFQAAVVMLLLIPLFSMGGMNDFAMRASTAPLAVLAFIGIEIILTKPWRSTLPLTLAFALGVGTPYAEMSRGYRWADHAARVNTPKLVMRLDLTNGSRIEYVAPYPNKFVRAVSSVVKIDIQSVPETPTLRLRGRSRHHR
jgi:hypothetical protein